MLGIILSAVITFVLGFIAGRMSDDGELGTTHRPLTSRDVPRLSPDEDERLTARLRREGAI